MSAIKSMSLFVPHIFPNFTQKYVAQAFSEIGEVERVDFVSKLDRYGKPFNAAYIHLKKWHNSHFANSIMRDIEFGNAKFYHDDSEYYWIILPNTAKKHVSGDRKPRIDLGESNSITSNKIPDKLVLKRSEYIVPDAPVKPKCVEFEECIDSHIIPDDNEWDELDAKASEEAAQMEEIEAELEIEDQYLVSIDSRYVATIEYENMMLRYEIGQLRQALINLDQMYQAEAAKVRAFSNVEK